MNDKGKTKEQLVSELARMRRQIAKMEKSRSGNKTSMNVRIPCEEWYNLLFNNVSDAVFVHWGPDETNMPGTFIEVNEAACNRLGYNREELLQMRPSDIDAPETIGNVPVMMKILLKDGEALWEGAHVSKEGQRIPVEIHNRLFDSGGRQLILSTVRDISARKEMEEALRESEQRFRSLAETTSDWIWEVDRDGFYTYTNPKVFDLLGYDPAEVLGKRPFEFMPPHESERVSILFADIVESLKPFSYLENVNLHKDGHEVMLETSGVPVFDEDGSYSGCRGIDRDITARKRVEEDLQESEKRYRLLVENSNDIIYSTDDKGFFTFANTAAERFVGEPRSNIVGKNYLDLVRPESRDEAGAFYRQQYSENNPNSYSEFPIINRKGETKWIGQNVQQIFSYGKVVGFQAVARDITERREAEEALKRSEKLYRSVIDNIHDTFYRTDVTGNLIMMSRSGAELFGYDSVDEMISLNVAKSFYFNPEDRNKILSEIETQGFVKDFELVLRRRDWTPVDVSVSTRKYFDEHGNMLGVEGILRDISKRKRAEDALRKSEREKSAILDAMSEIVLYVDKDLRVLWSNRATTLQFNLPASQIEGRFCYEALHGLNRPCKICPVLKAVEPGRPYIIDDFSSLGKRWTMRAYPVWDDDRNLAGIVEIVTDITARKQAETLYKSMAESSLAAVFIVQDGIFRFINNSAIAYAGYTAEELIGQNSDLIVHPEDREMAKNSAREMLCGKDTTPYEFRMVTKEGGVRWVMQIVSPIQYGGKPALLGNALDITNRKRAEEALRESEDKFRVLTEKAVVGVYLIQDGRFVYLNPRLVGMLGYTTLDELAARVSKLEDVIAKEDWKRTKEYLRKRLSGEMDSIHYQFRMVKKNGDVISVEAYGSRIIYNGRPAIIGTILDISDRKLAEEEQRRSEKLRSILEMAGAVCHEMNQPMQIISGYSDLLSMNIPENDPIKEKLDIIGQQIGRMATITRKLMTIKDYKTQDYAGISRIVDINNSSDKGNL
ncbi:MAG TPA: PAS domain S-box protein [Syntrophales bacterium]|nr:PAS domain S-box protein [Syntrophales bacterium]